MKKQINILIISIFLISFLAFAQASSYSTSYLNKNYVTNSETWKYKEHLGAKNPSFKITHTWTSPKYGYYQENFVPDYQVYNNGYPSYYNPYQSDYSYNYYNNYQTQERFISNYHTTSGYPSYYNQYPTYDSSFQSQYQSSQTFQEALNIYNSDRSGNYNYYNNYPRYNRFY